MKLDYLIKAMLAGMAFPSFFLPLVYTGLYLQDSAAIESTMLAFIPMYLPMLFGLANVIYLKFSNSFPVKDINAQLWITGACLGLLVALVGIFMLQVPELVFGIQGGLKYMPILFLPIVYGAIYRTIVKWLNIHFGI